MQPLSRHDKVYCARAKPGEEVEPTRGDRELKRDPRIDLAAANPVVGVWVEIVHKIENRAARKSIVNHLNFATSRAQDLNEIPSVLVASSVVAIGYYDHMSEGQARDQRCEESDGHPVFENGPSFHPNHDDLPIEIISVVTVLLTGHSSGIVQILIYATSVPVITA